MIQKLRKTLATLGVGLLLAIVPASMPVAMVAAAPTTGDTGGTSDQIGSCLGQGADLKFGDGTSCAPSGTGASSTEKINGIITTIINVFSIVVGIVAVIMIIFGGFKYITSGGDSGNITSAKNTIIYAVIGLVVVALAQFFVQFVLGKVNG